MNSALGAITTGPGRVIFMLAGIVILCVVLYYLYKYLSGDAEKADMVVFANSSGGLPGNSTTTFSAKNIPAIYGGGEYSVCVWIYIANWKVNSGKNKTFLTINSATGGYNTLQMYLGANVNKVGIRVSTDAAGDELNASQQGNIDNASNIYSDNEANFKQGDIKSVDLQKWVCICVVLSGRRLDVYMDGKLNRSSVLKGMYKVGGTGTDYQMIVGGNPPSRDATVVKRPGFGGLIGQINAANYAYTPDRVWALYSNGPQDTSITSLIKSYFDPGQYSFSLKRNGEDVIAGSTPA